ncbi:THO complex subunit 3-like [Sycon ciliatum]|uniref:THO complex subunit 3-like n=1 Tax=Sycon ciliatum TaxID=27933 RepID=UPI0020AE238A|eukprot:scpid73843/ scgid6422/ THO complex subunit 3; TEX1 homolog; hTREX45
MAAIASRSSNPATYLTEAKHHFQRSPRLKEVAAHRQKAHSVAWNKDGRRLASGSMDYTVAVFSCDRDSCGVSRDALYRDHSDIVNQVCWNPQHPDQLVSASEDKSIRLWDARANRCMHLIKTSGENINLTWSPDGQTIAVGNKDDLIVFIDPRTYKARAEEQFKFEVNEITWNNDNDLFFLTNGHGSISILSYPELKVQHTLNAHPANCISIKMDPTNKYFATGSADALATLWDLDELVCVRTFSRLDWPVRSLSFSHDGQMLASASEDLFIDISMVETGEAVCQVTCNAPTFSVAWHPSKHLLAFACDDKDKHERDSGSIRLFGIPSSSS